MSLGLLSDERGARLRAPKTQSTLQGRMFTVPTDKYGALNKGKLKETWGERWFRKSSFLAMTSMVCYPLYRGWVAYVSQFEYIRQETGQLKVPWSASRYRGWSETMWRLPYASWYRGIIPFLAIGPIVHFHTGLRPKIRTENPTNLTLIKYVTWHTALVGFCEMICYPLRYTCLIMASEPHNAPLPRPTTAQVMTDVFKYGLMNRGFKLAFWPGFLASYAAALPTNDGTIAGCAAVVAYVFNVVSIRLMIASMPGAPRPYRSVGFAFVDLFRSSPRIWLAGLPSFFIPVITFAVGRTTLENTYVSLVTDEK